MRTFSKIMPILFFIFIVFISTFIVNQTKKNIALFENDLKKIHNDLDKIDNSLKEFKSAMNYLKLSLEDLKNRVNLLENKVDKLWITEDIIETKDSSGLFIYFKEKDMIPIKNLF